MLSIHPIRRRLFFLLLRSFVVVVGLIYTVVLLFTGIYLGLADHGKLFLQPPAFSALEAYYLARGNWEGVEVIFTEGTLTPFPNFFPRWDKAMLLDESGRVVLEQGLAAGPLVGSLYSPQAGDEPFPLSVQGRQVGTLVLPGRGFSSPFQAIARLLASIALLSFVPALLTLLIGLFLTRRMIHPLAEVIAAAQAVAGGDLSARVTVRGPDDLRALTDSFNQMAGTLQRNDRERRQMLADVAHELRTPLTVIRGRLEGIMDGVYTPDESHVAQVLEQTYLLERLVEDLRLLTLAEARQLHFERRPTDLHLLAQRSVALFSAQAAEKNITLRLDADAKGESERFVLADAQRVEQVIGNLLENALRYTPAGGQVEVSIGQTPQGLELAVMDNGNGVPDEDLPHLFDRFWRSEKSRSRVAGGTGLGLAIARQLIEAQGGQIFARKAEGGGLQVGFRLPAGDPAA